MNYQYHRQSLTTSDASHPMIVEAISMLDSVEKAMTDLVAGKITIEKYIKLITPYDQFMYERAKMKPQKSNPINTLQNKKYSTWREQKWAPIWAIVKNEVEKAWKITGLEVIQNQSVVECVYDTGYLKYKDVDGGIGFRHEINGKKVLIPIVAVEDKGGHACSTCFDGVSAQSLRLHRCFPNAYHVFITDNNISVGKDKGAELFDDIDLIVSERGQNARRESYPALNASRFEEVKTGLIARLTATKLDQFKIYNTITSRKTGNFRGMIDTNGILWNR